MDTNRTYELSLERSPVLLSERGSALSVAQSLIGLRPRRVAQGVIICLPKCNSLGRLSRLQWYTMVRVFVAQT